MDFTPSQLILAGVDFGPARPADKLGFQLGSHELYRPLTSPQHSSKEDCHAPSIEADGCMISMEEAFVRIPVMHF